MSGDLEGMSLTGRASIVTLRCRAKTSATDLWVREALGKHLLGMVVGGERELGGAIPLRGYLNPRPTCCPSYEMSDREIRTNRGASRRP